MVLGRIVFVVIYPENKGDVFVLRGSGNDHLLYRAAKMLLGIVSISKAAGGFDDHLRAYTFPRQSGWIFLFEDFDGLAIHGNAVGAGADFVRQIAQH